MNKKFKPSSAVVGSLLASSVAMLGTTNSLADGFGAKELSGGYMQLASADKGKEGACGEGKCGGEKKAKGKEGACGEGKCGGSKAG